MKGDFALNFCVEVDKKDSFNELRMGSLFDGVGGFPLAATRFGIKPIWASEIEEFPIMVTKERFHCVKHLGNVMEINGAEIEPVDIITFGSPCQDMSVAGKRKGMGKSCLNCGLYFTTVKELGDAEYCPECGSSNIDATRSGLSMEAIRIIREMRAATNDVYPRFAVWENVPGAFSSSCGADFLAMLEELLECKVPMPESGKWASAGLIRANGRELAWRVIDAQFWGVPQRRKRIFMVCDYLGECAGEILFNESLINSSLK